MPPAPRVAGRRPQRRLAADVRAHAVRGRAAAGARRARRRARSLGHDADRGAEPAGRQRHAAGGGAGGAGRAGAARCLRPARRSRRARRGRVAVAAKRFAPMPSSWPRSRRDSTTWCPGCSRTARRPTPAPPRSRARRRSTPRHGTAIGAWSISSIAAGADLQARDEEHDATPRGWAETVARDHAQRGGRGGRPASRRARRLIARCRRVGRQPTRVTASPARTTPSTTTAA